MILKHTNPASLDVYLKENKWLLEAEQVKATSIPGSGNMNYVIRVHTADRSIILKQSVPYVEKYPQVEAPQERIHTEYLFYQYVAEMKTAKLYMPATIGFDSHNHILCMEDAGKMENAGIVYNNPSLLTESHIELLVDYLNDLHSFSANREKAPGFENSKMKTLNALHIFDFPFRENNGFNLDSVQPGLQNAALPYKQNSSLKKKVNELKAAYLASGNYLLHGDYYPGSWLIQKKGLKIIDPEFCFYGVQEFDLSVLVAHLKIAGCPTALLQKVTSKYVLPVNKSLLAAFTGIEILRRLIGLAQLPLQLSLSKKQNLLEEAVHLIE
jgi:5-methylthioribose kinase